VLEYKTVAYSPLAAYTNAPSQEDVGAEGGDEEFVDSRLAGFMDYDDGSKIVVEKDYVLLDLEEYNVDFKKENFDIEIYEVIEEATEAVITDGGTEVLPKPEKLQQLYFKLNPLTAYANASIHDPMFDEQEVDDPNCVEYYLDIKVDHEIGADIMCKYKEAIKSRTFLDSLFDCPDEDGDMIRVNYGFILAESDTDTEGCD